MHSFTKSLRTAVSRHQRWVRCVVLVVLATATLLGQGCGDSGASQRAERAQKLPKTQFEWGMERLQRALRAWSRPSTADGLFTERKMTHELVEPADSSSRYTAKVTVTTMSEFIHAKRKVPKKEAKEQESEDDTEFDDLRTDKSDEMAELLDLTGAGPNAPTAPAPIVEPRSLASEAVFELAYIDGEWKLQTEPEHKYEKLWFEYAFPER